MRWWRTMVVAGVCIGAAVGPVAEVAADDGWRRVRVRGDIEFADPGSSPISCDTANHCVVGLWSVNQYSGGLDGTSESRQVVAFDQATGQASITAFELFTGHVRGCGDGSFTMSGAITRLLQSPGTGTLEVVAGTGSGDLTGVRGRGTFTVTPTGPASATSEFELELRCRKG